MSELRPVREGDTLGRAGRVSAKGNRVETARVRELRPEDKRRVTLTDHPDPALEVHAPEPPEGTVVTDDGHRALLHLDGRGEARPPKDWEDENSAKRAEVGRREAELNLRATRRAREQLSLSQRIAQLEHATLRMQSQRARTLGNDADRRRGADTRDQAPQGEGHGAVGFARPFVVEAHWRLMLLHAKRLEAFFDAHEGRAVEDPFLFSQAEKDQLLTGRELRGLSPESIFVLYDGALGDVKAIRYARRMAGLDPLGNEQAPREEAA